MMGVNTMDVVAVDPSIDPSIDPNIAVYIPRVARVERVERVERVAMCIDGATTRAVSTCATGNIGCNQ